MKIDINEELIALLGGAPSLDYETSFANYPQQVGQTQGGKILVPPHQPSEQATEFADALLSLLAAKVELEAYQRRDSYYGSNVARYEDAYNRAVTRLWKAVGGR